MPSIVQGQTGSQPFTCPDGTPAIFDGNQGFYCQNSNGAVTGAQGGEADGWSIANAIVGGVAKFIGQSLMSIAALVLSIAGYLFDGVMEYTVVNMSTKLGNGPGGLGGGITAAWATLRDIANMCFIFVLLFTAFKAMFELNFGNVGKTIKDIIIIALLINFSLFFTKVVIDTSNVVSTGFYNSIVTTNPVGAGSGTSVPSTDRTISGNYMRLLGLQSWWSPKALTVGINERADKILMVGVMSSIFFLVTAVILLITSVMFVARFILLIFLMILSPLAFIAYIIPGQKGQFEKWWQALINQSFFAPLFFAMTWVVFMVANGLKASVNLSGLSAADTTFIDAVSSSTAGGLGGHIGIILNFVIITGLSIAALVFSKQMASKTAGFNAISGGIGAAGAGVTAWGARNSIGRGATVLAQSSGLRNAAASNKWYSSAARAGLWTANKGSGSSFDVSNSNTLGKIPGLGKEMSILGKASGKGGFNKSIEDKAKKKADYAKAVYGTSPVDKERDENAKKELENEIKLDKSKDVTRIKAERKAEFDTMREESKKKTKEANDHERTKLKNNFDNLEELKKERKAKEVELQAARKRGANDLEIESLEKESESLGKSIELENQNISEARKDLEENDQEYISKKEAAEDARNALNEAKKDLKSKIKDNEYSEEIQKKMKAHKDFENSGNKRQKAYAKKVGSGVFGWTAGNQAAMRKIEEQVKGKSKEKQIAELLKDEDKNEVKEEKKEESEKKT